MEITEKKASSLRRYFYEYVVIGLVIAVVTLFGLYYNLNNFINRAFIETINANTIQTMKNNDYLSTLKK